MRGRFLYVATANDIRGGSVGALLAGMVGIGVLVSGGVAFFLGVWDQGYCFPISLMVGSAMLGVGAWAGPIRRGWSVVLDAEGVTAEQVFGPWRRAGRVLWSELVEVGIVTSASPRASGGFHWVLLGEGDTHCVVPLGLSQEVDLFGALKALPGFDHDAVAHACGSPDDATHRCWRGRAAQLGSGRAE